MKRISSLITILLLSLFSTLAWSVDINKADAQHLAAEISGVGAKRAQAIVEYRQAHGPFQSVDDLAKVKGIGSGLLEKNRDNLVASKAE